MGLEPAIQRDHEAPFRAIQNPRWEQRCRNLPEQALALDRKRADGRTPYAVAELNGNRAVADWLLAHGASPELAEVDRLVAACSRGDRKAAEALLATNPDLRGQITDDHYIALHQAAERNDVRALEAMLASGFDPNRTDAGIGKTALHSAAMEGWPDAVRGAL